MIHTIRTIRSNTTYPYINQALERFLFDTVPEDVLILFLYQNEKTAVIGQHQDIRQTLDLDYLSDHGIFPVRRLSGGGLVLQEKNILGFSFLTKGSSPDFALMQTAVQKACQTEDNKSLALSNFSYKIKDRYCFHGYITMDSQSEDTTDKLCGKLYGCFEEVFDKKALPFAAAELDPRIVGSYEKIFADESYIFNEERSFTKKLEAAYTWGSISLGFDVREGKISSPVIYSDCSKAELITQLKRKLSGCDFTKEVLKTVIRECCEAENASRIGMDLCSLIDRQL